jgi:hypothetical protein
MTPKQIAALQAENVKLKKVLEPFARYYDLNDCKEWDPDDALEIPIEDLRVSRNVYGRSKT